MKFRLSTALAIPLTLAVACGPLPEGDPEGVEVNLSDLTLSSSNWQAFWDYVGADIDRVANEQRALGRRPVSVAAYGTTSAPRFAVQFVQGGGPEWRLARGNGTGTFSSRFTTEAAMGFKPTLLSFDGPENAAVWAAVFERSSTGIPFTRHALTSGDVTSDQTIQFWLKKARDEKRIPTTLSVYGTDLEPRYAIVLEANPTNVDWSVTFNDPASVYQQRSDAHALGGNRAAIIDLNAAQRYTAMFCNDSVGSAVWRHGMTASTLKTTVTDMKAKGLFPTAIQAGGSGTGVRFAAIFAKSTSALPRAFTATGSTDAADTAIPAVDTVMSSFMQANDIRQAALAVVRGRRLAYARGYTFAEAGWRTTQPTTFFRTASVSKVVTAVEIMRMVERGDITLNTTVQSILNLRTPSGGNPNARFAGITINDLLTHNYSTLGGDCLAENPAVDQAVAKAFQVKLPVTQMQSARFMVGSANLFWTPGAGDRCYSNFGYTLLSMVVANRRGSFWSALQTDVLGPLAIKRARVSSSDATLNTTSEALYQTDGLDVVFDVNRSNSPLALEAYGEANHAVTFAAGGLSFAAPDLVRILAMLNMRGSNNPVFRNRQTIGTALTNGTLGFEQSITDTIPGTHYIKGGFMAGLQSNAYFTSGVKNGLSYVVLFARDGIPRPGAGANFYPTWSNLETALLAPASNLSGRQDFFPTYGMPSLPNDPAIPCTMDSQCMAPDICWDGVCTIPVGP